MKSATEVFARHKKIIYSKTVLSIHVREIGCVVVVVCCVLNFLKRLQTTFWRTLQLALFFLLILQVQSNITVFNFFLPYLLKTDIDDCAGHPCENNGTCTDRVNGFNCSCAPGFNGMQCEIGNRNR